MTDFALVCRTYAGEPNWYFVPKVSTFNIEGVVLELEMGTTEDGTRYSSQPVRMDSLFLPANLEILAALRKLIHDVPPTRIPSLDENGRLAVDYTPISLSFPETPPTYEGDRCDNPECCPPILRADGEPAIAGHGRNIEFDESAANRERAVRNLCHEDAILLGLSTADEVWPPSSILDERETL